jgi:hypothetical protein
VREYTSRIETKRLADARRKDALLDLIARDVGRRRLTHRDVQAVCPKPSPRQLSDIKSRDRTVGSIEMLEGVARALGLKLPENESLECAA